MARVGLIAYANLSPLVEGLVPPDGIETTTGVPTDLNARLEAGELDASFVSTAHWIRHQASLERLSGIGIVSPGPVRSVILEHSRPTPRTFHLTRASATSVALLQLLAVHHFRWLPAGGRLETVDDPAAAEARLMIGDEALVRAHANTTPWIDLGEAWTRFSRLPMVWAVVCCRRDLEASRRALVDAWHQRLVAAAALPLRDAVIPRVARKFQLPEDYVRMYLGGLEYRVESREEEGLRRFADLVQSTVVPTSRRPESPIDEPVLAHRPDLR